MNQRRGRGAYSPSGGPPGAQGSNAGARGALLLAVAVIIGIVILQQFDTGGVDVGQVSTDITVPSEETTTTRRVGLTTVPPQTPTTARLRPKGEVQVLVANGAGVRGLGAATTAQLKNLGWGTLNPIDATATVERTGIQYVEGYEAEARDLATALTLPAAVVTRLAAPPVSDVGEAKLVVLLGTDIASTTTTAAGATTSTTRRP